MYQNSRIDVLFSRGKERKGVLITICSGSGHYLLFNADKPTEEHVASWCGWEHCTPILLHLEDMTEAECIDYTEFVWSGVEFSEVNRNQKIKVIWAKDNVNLRETYRQCLFAVRQKGIMWPFFPREINQRGALWLIRHGFDIYNLIESGQARRKEVNNG